MAVDLEEQRTAIRELIPEALEKAMQILRKPGRNSIAQLNVIKMILDRGGLPAIQDVQLSGASDGRQPLQIIVRSVLDKPTD